mmetsp:Transcript_6774/g.41364  ORF Transcript_6774/g.41364 Transcript_6774/m.41364 type:complete len:147 (+) Transcript_6774:89-529(+)
MQGVFDMEKHGWTSRTNAVPCCEDGSWIVPGPSLQPSTWGGAKRAVRTLEKRYAVGSRSVLNVSRNIPDSNWRHEVEDIIPFEARACSLHGRKIRTIPTGAPAMGNWCSARARMAESWTPAFQERITCKTQGTCKPSLGQPYQTRP